MLIFITPPSAKELENRLRGRNTEDEATILARLSRAYDESEGLEEYDYIILNDEVEKCVERIVGVVTSEKMKTANNEELINKVKEELKAYSKGEQ